jgi:4-amino-4-deoxy-L-arabinose transferase-like glycosyltransferase
MLKGTDNRWAAATVGSHTAGGLELSTGTSIMAIGGFSGGDDSPTLAQFQQYVHDGRVRYFLAREDREGGGPGGFGGSADSAGNQITDWVQANFTFQTVDGTTVYDLQD